MGSTSTERDKRKKRTRRIAPHNRTDSQDQRGGGLKGDIFTRRHQKGLLFHPCGPFCVDAGWKQRRNVAHSLRHRMRMLQDKDKSVHNSFLGWRKREGRTLLARVAVHVGLQRRRTRESLVADLALVLLLGVGGHLGAKLAHHGLRARGGTAGQERGRTREGPRGDAIVIGFRGGRAVIGHGRVHRRNGSAVIGVIPAGGDGRPGGMSGREAIRVSRTPGIPRAIDIAWGEILAEGHHSATGIQCIAKGWTGSRRLRLTNTRVPN